MKLETIFCAAIAALCTVACSDDNDTTATLAELASGTYTGEMTLTVAGNSAGSTTMGVTIAPESATTVGITLTGDPEATGGMTLKNIPLTGVSVATENGSTYTLAKTIGAEGYTVQDTGTATAWKFTVVEGSVTDGAATLRLIGQPGAMPMAITMDFKGTK